MVSHSIDIINNNPFNKKRFIKILNKRENDINKILNKNNEDFIKDKIFIRKSSYDIPQNDIDFKTNENSKKELFSELYINNDTNNNIKNKFIESHKDLNRDRINFQYPKKINKEEINKLISHKIDIDCFEEEIIPQKIKDFYESQKRIEEEGLFFEKNRRY